MDIIILGFLMIKSSTLYELRQQINSTLSKISSSSTGSIQAALKKLLKAGMITFVEQVEGGVNKKIYSITDSGKEYFEEKIAAPMLHKEKNMELSKFFFMGFVDPGKRVQLIRGYIDELKNELAVLEQMNANLEPRYPLSPMTDERFSEDELNGIAQFQYATLDLDMAKLKFEIQWFQEFVAGLEEKNS
ncbi:helix-turn-helix transcriptional regulator [Enterococcus sp. 669A]|uniref:Helix-turn-helix transcriptional regulator n=1 Tax=Candidatus Enterococcus moelleringii TaxID=2815325 RepID=A0ABS3LCW6_9ENTE|nr:helix-turn-helix transcriptional regulator [Enterococcus sp. 669A]MBO1306873.1 helix-turn-helix transcriptional regulator [Enterococcus sp. 669A]